MVSRSERLGDGLVDKGFAPQAWGLSLNPQHPHQKPRACAHACTNTPSPQRQKKWFFLPNIWSRNADWESIIETGLKAPGEKNRGPEAKTKQKTQVAIPIMCAGSCLQWFWVLQTLLLEELKNKALGAPMCVCGYGWRGFFLFSFWYLWVFCCWFLFCLPLERVLLCCSGCFQTPGYKWIPLAPPILTSSQ